MGKNYFLKRFEHHDEYLGYVLGGGNAVALGDYTPVERLESDDRELNGEMYYAYTNDNYGDFYTKVLFAEGVTRDVRIYYWNGTNRMYEGSTVSVLVPECEYMEPHVSFCAEEECVQYNISGTLFICEYARGEGLAMCDSGMRILHTFLNDGESADIKVPSDGIIRLMDRNYVIIRIGNENVRAENDSYVDGYTEFSIPADAKTVKISEPPM